MTTKEATIKATCQICGRKIGAKTGYIALHGYRRPYEGWQTASCEGALHLPYELTCELLTKVAGGVRSFLIAQEKEQAAFLACAPETITVWEKRGAYDNGKNVTYTRPENFDPSSYHHIPRTYDDAYASKKYGYERTIREAKAELETMRKRIQDWSKVSAWFEACEAGNSDAGASYEGYSYAVKCYLDTLDI